MSTPPAKGKGACPPEDSCGLWDYYDMHDILAQPHHPEHKDVKRWPIKDQLTRTVTEEEHAILDEV